MDNMQKISKWKAIKIIFFFLAALTIITGTLAAVVRTFMNTGYHHLLLIPVILVLMNLTYIWIGRSQRNSFIFAVIIAFITAVILRIVIKL